MILGGVTSSTGNLTHDRASIVLSSFSEDGSASISSRTGRSSIASSASWETESSLEYRSR